MAEAGTIVIGLGTGRCGTNTLAALLDRQDGARVTHERHDVALRWEGSEILVQDTLRSCRRELDGGSRLVGDVHSAYLPYAESMLRSDGALRLIALQRERAATVDSFLRKTERKANHWAPTPRFARRARWNDCFPTYPAELPKDQAIGRYWDEYYTEVERLAAAFPGRVALLPMEALNDDAGQRRILAAAGVPEARQRREAGLRLNVEVPRPHGLRALILRLLGRGS